MPAYTASKGWVGLRLDTTGLDWDEVSELVTGSYRLVAPKRLAARAIIL
jgi:predicted DNA-binding protein (MmcQ/YjbR family)